MRISFLFLALTSSVLASNPLATQQQRELDARATRLSKSGKLDDLRQKAYDQYYKTLRKYNVHFDQKTKHDLNIAIDEFVFSSIQKAVNDKPSSPHVYWIIAPPRKHNWFGESVPGGRVIMDNPDCIYRSVPISNKYTYRLKGKRFGNGTSDVTFTLVSNIDAQTSTTTLDKKQLQVNQDGTYEILISPEKSQKPNHIKSDWQSKALLVRHNLGDWGTETPDALSVELVGHKAQPNLSDEEIIKVTRGSLEASIPIYGFGVLDVKTFSNPVNSLKKPPKRPTLGALPTQSQSFGHYSLNSDEALVVTLTAGNSDYWVIPVNSVGLVTHKPSQGIVSFNSKQAHANKNGTYTVVISQTDPGAYNWIPTYGRKQGTLLARWQGFSQHGGDRNGLDVYTQVVPLRKLRQTLPHETKYISKGERQQQVQKRREQFARIHSQ